MSFLFPPKSKLWKENSMNTRVLDGKGSMPSRGKAIVEYRNFNLLQNIPKFRGEK